jgi:hypothetical protein
MNVLLLIVAIQLQPEPDAAARKQGEADLKGQFKIEYARRLPGDVRALAARLLEGASSGEFREPGMRYSAFAEARNLYLRVGDIPEAFKSVDAMASVFSVDVVAEKTSFLSRASSGASGDALSYVANLYFAAASQALALERFEDAQKLFSACESSASLCKDFQLRDSASYQRSVCEAFKGALQRSKKGDVDMGRWLCFFKGDWAGGLLPLSAGTDDLAAAAKLEISGLASVEASVRAADLWWESVSKEKPGQVKDSARAHAIDLFSKVSGAGNTWIERFSERRRIVERERFGDRVECVPGVKLRSRGVELMPEIGDGRCQIGYFNGRPSVRTGVTETGPCVYFNVSDAWLQKGVTLEVSVDYFDAGGTLTMGVSEVKGVKPPEGVQMGVSSSWKTYVAKVSSDAFINGIHGADFRMVVTGKEGYIGRVSIRKAAK